MLRELHVRNLAVVAEAAVRFGEGFNVLTGETGAGKSIVVDSLFLLAGARASGDLIRSGAETLTVAGVFAPAGTEWRQRLEEAGVQLEGDELLIRREIGRGGRNRVLVNDQPTTLRLLTELAPSLLRIHGQRDENELLVGALQREWLDRSGGEEAERLGDAVAAGFDRHARLAERLARVSGDGRERLERLDLLRFQAGEIEAARLEAGEDHALRAERDVLRNVEAISQALGTAQTLLAEEEGAASERLSRAETLLADIAEWEPEAAGWSSELAEVGIRLGEVAAALARRLSRLEADPRRLDAVEERLALLERLCRRHGGDVAAVIARGHEIAAELADLEQGGEDQTQLAAQVAAALEEYRQAALALSKARRAWGERLARGIEAELGDLGLGQARLGVAIEPRVRAGSPLVVGGQAIEFGPLGIDQVSFLFAPNPGEETRPLSRIASGGELARLSLALQLAATGAAPGSGAHPRPTLVFDEVDNGVGGAEAAALGRKLERLSREGQILAVTHLPQVASHADRHFKVSKRVRAGRTAVTIEELETAPRVEEVARMLAGGALTPLSLSHAAELIAGARAGAGGGHGR